MARTVTVELPDGVQPIHLVMALEQAAMRECELADTPGAARHAQAAGLARGLLETAARFYPYVERDVDGYRRSRPYRRVLARILETEAAAAAGLPHPVGGVAHP